MHVKVSRAQALTGAAMVLGAIALNGPESEAATGQKVTMYVFRGKEKIMGPDGKSHDAIVPSDIVTKAGEPVTVTVVDYDESPHSITCPELGLDQTIKAGKQVGQEVQPVSTTFTFTANKPGVYRWHCKYPCDMGAKMWAMGAGYGGPDKEGFMSGRIIVL
jgi:plastocyanin